MHYCRHIFSYYYSFAHSLRKDNISHYSLEYYSLLYCKLITHILFTPSQPLWSGNITNNTTLPYLLRKYSWSPYCYSDLYSVGTIVLLFVLVLLRRSSAHLRWVLVLMHKGNVNIIVVLLPPIRDRPTYGRENKKSNKDGWSSSRRYVALIRFVPHRGSHD